eukprot:10761059-Heterocapsa_arctica.AAC.1
MDRDVGLVEDMVLASVRPPAPAHLGAGDPTAPRRRSDVRRGTGLCVGDGDLRVEDRNLCAEDPPVVAGSCMFPPYFRRGRDAFPCR